MNWFYRYSPEGDYVSQDEEPLKMHDMLLGSGDVLILLQNAGFSKQNSERLIMARFKKFDPDKDGSLLVPGVTVRCKDPLANNATYEGTILREEGADFIVVNSTGEILVELSEILQYKIPNETTAVNNTNTLEPPPQPQLPNAKKEVTADMVIAAYIKTRDAIEAEKKKCEEAVAKLKEVQGKREQWLANQLAKLKLTNFKAKGVGTAFFKTRSSATIADAAQFVSWVREDWNAREQFLEKRVSKTAVDEAVKDGNAPPPGTNYTTIQVVQINRA